MIGIVTIVLVVLNIALNAAMLAMYLEERRHGRIEKLERKTDEIVEREMKRDIMDEGFENIMSYSVNGRNGFDDR